MNKATLFSLILFGAIALSAGLVDDNLPEPVAIPVSAQRIGNAQNGYAYLVSGDYVKGGVPQALFSLGYPKEPIYLEREGRNKKLPHGFNAVTAPNGEPLVAPNCMQCHAQVFEDQLYIGLGNTFIDFSNSQRPNAKGIGLVTKVLKTTAPKAFEASSSFFTVTRTIAPGLVADVRGVNLAGRLTNLLIAHRDPQTSEWSNDPQLPVPDEALPTDTPPWWLLKKKNGMFYNGFGRGDFGRFLMGSSLLTVKDTAEANAVDRHMPDLLAYIYSLEPPKYPKAIDETLAANGKIIFEKRCASCHGSYGSKEKFPNLLIPQVIIGTDSMLQKSNRTSPQFVAWFNNSWFASGDNPARLEPFDGYIAPPLDGVWITAPYLHNASVPTLEALLNSKLRPEYWSRYFEKPEYDYEKLGWKHTVHPVKKGVYNTALPGYGNYGHTFGDKLTGQERRAVLEYLKTL